MVSVKCRLRLNVTVEKAQTLKKLKNIVLCLVLAYERLAFLKGLDFFNSYISCGSTRNFAHGKVRLYPWEVCVLFVNSIPTVKLPMGNHYGYIKKNKRITHDVSRTKSWGLVLVYLTTRVVQPIGWKKKLIPETAAHDGHIFVVLR